MRIFTTSKRGHCQVSTSGNECNTISRLNQELETQRLTARSRSNVRGVKDTRSSNVGDKSNFSSISSQGGGWALGAESPPVRREKVTWSQIRRIKYNISIMVRTKSSLEALRSLLAVVRMQDQADPCDLERSRRCLCRRER